MKAVQVLSKAVVDVVDVDMPEKQDNVLIRTQFASICGSDLHMMFSGWGIDKWPSDPGHPGHEAVGVVVDGNDEFKTDDYVLTVPHIWNSKCFAEFQSVDTQHLIKIDQPNSTPIEHLSMAQQLGTVIFAAKQIHEIKDKRCLVIGQGSAGLFWNYILKYFGAKSVIAIDPISHRADLGHSFGADQIFDKPLSSIIDDSKSIQKDSIDIVIEAVGTAETVNGSLQVVRDSGLVVFFGLPESDDLIPFDFSTMFKNRIKAFTIFGSQDENGLSSFRLALDMIKNSKIDVSNVITHTFPLVDAVTAFEYAKNRNDGVVKVGLHCN